MKTLRMLLILSCLLLAILCKKEENNSDASVLALLGLSAAGGGTATVICGGAAFCSTFVTSSFYDGNMGGISGADAKCTAEKPAALTGTFKALLIAPGTRTAVPAVDWVLAAGKEYRRQNQTTPIFTTDSSRLISQTPLTNSVAGAVQFYWTGLDAQSWTHMGTASHCSGWTSTAGNGGLGNANVTPTFGTGPGGAFGLDTTVGCNNNSLLRLFCVQQ